MRNFNEKSVIQDKNDKKDDQWNESEPSLFSFFIDTEISLFTYKLLLKVIILKLRKFNGFIWSVPWTLKRNARIDELLSAPNADIGMSGVNYLSCLTTIIFPVTH